MKYDKLLWESDFLSTELFGDDVEEFNVGIYRLKDFPEILVYVDTENAAIFDAFLNKEDE
jgi:hypothetical protein